MNRILGLFKNFNIKEPSTWGGIAILGLMIAGGIPPEVGLGILGQMGGEEVGVGQVVGGSMGVLGTLVSMFTSEGGKKLMLAFLLVPIVFIGAGSDDVMAASQVTVSWDYPTQRENGDAIEISEIGGYLITVDLPDGTTVVYDETAGDSRSYQYTPLDPGIYVFRVQAYDKSDPIQVSDYSNSYSGTMTPGGNALQAVTITIVVTCEGALTENCEFRLVPTP